MHLYSKSSVFPSFEAIILPSIACSQINLHYRHEKCIKPNWIAEWLTKHTFDWLYKWWIDYCCHSFILTWLRSLYNSVYFYRFNLSRFKNKYIKKRWKKNPKISFGKTSGSVYWIYDILRNAEIESNEKCCVEKSQTVNWFKRCM